MREINFRGKRLDNGQWVYGAIFDGLANTVIFGKVHNTEHGGFAIYKEDCHHVDPETVGQYTGLEDKNGVKIYEGDIVTRAKMLTLVCWVDTYSRFVGKTHSASNDSVIFGFALSRVIGNVHDNPELLEVRKDD